MPTRTATPTPTQTPALSTIEGYVWEDRDRNGQWDAGEKGISGQKLVLDPPFTPQMGRYNQFTMTDSNGHYRFESVSPGTHFVGLLEVPMNHWPTTSTRVKVLSTVHETVFVSFGLYRLPPVSYLPLVQKGKE